MARKFIEDLDENVLTIVQGTTSALSQLVSVEDLTGWTFHAQIRPRVGSDTLLFEWTDGMIEKRPWLVILPLDPEVTAEWTWTSAWFGLEAVSPSGEVRRVIQCKVHLDREIVRQETTGG